MTELICRSQPDAVSCRASVINSGDDEKGHWVQVDRTVFYPQGGGQMSDRGTLQFNQQRINCQQVLVRDGEVRHYLDSAVALQPGDALELTIDADFRLLASRAHSAGHLISHVVETLKPELVPTKGHHFLPGAYVAFAGELTDDPQTFLQQVQQQLDAAIAAALPVTISSENLATITALRPELAGAIPQTDEIRLVTIGNYRPFACGGTHTGDTGSLQKVELTKIKRKDGVRISYTLSAS
ncbi:alanine--tRNA ligase-related protein [Erwiniaceae bacterium BAC15a-03b]|uniref:Alanine--tRNA ligase-related protein n=1 Tax=Winslowiella arboricola TaxID=2978220 RepID=A0A9J6PP02_9GAMM|nr:alanine--tRNA ligase-related protein [Winslowiella arboricola]MCU5773252.1 alanine--tRNA ligase-related protein [Winslowiella arboricola]MCU5779138.1 alanine--tRNA ligase-related protein [Winslowiella arboricola]